MVINLTVKFFSQPRIIITDTFLYYLQYNALSNNILTY